MIKNKFLVGAVLFLAVVMIASQGFAACNIGDKAQVLWKGSWYPATVLKVVGPKCFIHYDGYGSNWDEWVGSDRIKVAGGPAVGDALQILWKGTWYPAHVIEAGKGSQVKIHYDGYDNSWDEWVGPNRYKK